MHSQSSKIHDNSHNTCKYQDISAEIESDFLCCQVCCEHYTEAEERSPRVSPCGHTLCHACITSILAIADPNCPFCKHWYPAAATNYTFPKNFIVLGMMAIFPKTHGSFDVLEFSHHEKQALEEKVVLCKQDVGYYSELIQQEERHLLRLRDLERGALVRHQQVEEQLQAITVNIQRIRDRTPSSASNNSTSTSHDDSDCNATQIDITPPCPASAQLLPHLVPPPPPSRSAPHPLQQLQLDWRQQQRRQEAMQQGYEMQQQWHQQIESGDGEGMGGAMAVRNSMASQLHQRLALRRQTNQPAVVIPPRPPLAPEGGGVPELLRLFQHLQSGGSIATAAAAARV